MDNTKINNSSIDHISNAPREKRIGKTTYRVSSVYLGETDLKDSLERLAVRKVLEEINAEAKEQLKNEQTMLF